MTETEKALAGLLYQANHDPEITALRAVYQELNYDYNALRPGMKKEREKMIREHFGKAGDNCVVEQPFYADFWERIFVGDNFFSNYNFVVLAFNRVDIGDNVWIGPDCGIYAAGHPFDVKTRTDGFEYARPVRVGDNVWIGGGVKIMGGVAVGDNSVIAAGSIVTKSVPANVLAGGNPCRVIRKISPRDDEKFRTEFRLGDGEM